MSTRSRRLLAMSAALASALLGTAACSSGNAPTSTTSSSYPTAIAAGSTLHIYSWADYIAPDNIAAFERATGVKVAVDTYASSEEALAKLRLTSGTSGYDLVVMDGSYVPQLVANHALLPWDKARLPGMKGLSPAFVGKSWDPTNTYAIPKSGGSTGYVWDSAVLTTAPTSWNEFYTAFANPSVHGRTSVIDGAASFVTSYFWGNGIDSETTDPANYDKASGYFASTVMPHLKSFNSYPRGDLASGDVVLAQAFTGDARGAMIDGPKTLRFALGSPKTDLYVDHWVLPQGAGNIAAAHAFVQFLLEPEHAATDTLFHGYNTGVLASRDHLPADTSYLDIIFFDRGVPADRFVTSTPTPQTRKLSLQTFQRLKAQAAR